jgi:DNA primase
MSRYEQATIDLVSLIEQKAGISLSFKSRHFKFGREFCGPCPFCGGGRDRLIVWSDGERPHWWCRVCEREGSPAQFLMEHENMSFGEALAELGIPDDGDERTYTPPPLNEQLARGAPPSKVWQEGTRQLIERAEAYLWHPKSPEGRAALTYLRGRGLTDETIKRTRLGYVPLDRRTGRWYVGDFEQWGIDPDTLREDQRAKGGVRVPNGILIPWFADGHIWKLTIKRPGEDMDYGQVLGSSDGGLYNADSIEAGKPVMLVESEFCAASVEQEAGDIIACVATGSTGKGRHPRWLATLAGVPFVLQSFDADAKGDEASEYWEKKLSNCVRWRPWADEREDGGVSFKDPNDALQYADQFKVFTGCTLRGWVEQGMYAAELEPLEASQEHDSTPCKGTSSSADMQPSESCQDTIEEGSLEWFGGIISRMVDVLGGPAKVAVTRHDPGLTLGEYAKSFLRHGYTPAQPLLSEDAAQLPKQPSKLIDYQFYIHVQEEYDRLSLSERVQTPAGPGRYWDVKQLRAHIERDRVRVTLDATNRAELFPCAELEPLLEVETVAF